MDKKILKQLFIGLTRPHEGCDIGYYDNTLYIGIFFAFPRKDEIADFNKNINLFYFSLINNTMIVSAKIGDLSVCESSYHINKQPPATRINKIENNKTLNICVFLANPITGEIVAQKEVKANDGFRESFYAELHKQITEKNLFVHDNNADTIMDTYDTAELSAFMKKESFFLAGNA